MEKAKLNTEKAFLVVDHFDEPLEITGLKVNKDNGRLIFEVWNGNESKPNRNRVIVNEKFEDCKIVGFSKIINQKSPIQ